MGLEVDVVSYTSVVEAWARTRKPEEAEHWLAKLEAKVLEANVLRGRGRGKLDDSEDGGWDRPNNLVSPTPPNDLLPYQHEGPPTA